MSKRNVRALKGRPGPLRKGANGGEPRVRAADMLSHALGLFAEVGFANATVKAIAKAAGVNPALIYYYYANKEALFVEALRYAINMAIEGQDGMGIIERTADPAAVIRFWFEKNRQLASPLSQMLKLMIEYRTAGRRIPAVEKLISQFYDAEVLLLARAIRRGIKIGQFRRVDVDRTAIFVSTHLDGLVVSATVRPAVNMARSISHLERVLFDYLGAAAEAVPSAPVGRLQHTVPATRS
ncbi:MAG: TetR family transcriptional regulator [Rhizobiales bacterium]|nr:TetR family transcriptional regulator [Hyphomicrobiales bacterium]